MTKNHSFPETHRNHCHPAGKRPSFAPPFVVLRDRLHRRILEVVCLDAGKLTYQNRHSLYDTFIIALMRTRCNEIYLRYLARQVLGCWLRLQRWGGRNCRGFGSAKTDPPQFNNCDNYLFDPPSKQ